MARISDDARALYRQEMDAAKNADTVEARWHHLERAHIVSQPQPWPHTCNHVAMLKLALRQHDRREALGQVVRIIVAAPGSLSGRYPEGNTGRVAAGLMTPMPIPADLAAALNRSGAVAEWRQVRA
jgi:Protein of unknown function (DUF3703)